MYIIKYINFWNKNQYIKNYIDFIEFGLKKCNIDTIIDNNCKNHRYFNIICFWKSKIIIRL